MHFSRLPSPEFHSARYHRAANTPYFSLKIKKNDAREWRAGVVAGSAVSKLAARRNFWKRQTLETLRAALGTAGGDKSDLLVILFPKVDTLTKKQFREKLKASALAAARPPRP